MIAVLTTIQSPTPCVHRLISSLQPSASPLIVIGDKKGPREFPLDGVQFFPLERQSEMPFDLAATLPVGHYARKNLGYLEAIRQGAECIYGETDDDNAPNDTWKLRALETSVQKVAGRPWMNVYRVFSSENIWPRGFPLDAITPTPKPIATIQARRLNPSPLRSSKGWPIWLPTSMPYGVWRSIESSISNPAPACGCLPAPGVLSTAKPPGGGRLLTRSSIYPVIARSA